MASKTRGPDLDAAKIIRRFNGATELRRKLVKAGYDIKLKTIQMWAYRRRIPADWLPVLLSMAEAEGSPLSLYQYVRKQDGARRKAKAAPEDADFLE